MVTGELERDSMAVSTACGLSYPRSLRRVGVYAVAGIQTCAVGDHAVCLRCRRNHLASRAHAERKEAATVFGVGDKLVGGGPQGRMPCGASILSAVDIALEMLDTNAHGKGLALEGKITLGQ